MLCMYFSGVFLIMLTTSVYVFKRFISIVGANMCHASNLLTLFRLYVSFLINMKRDKVLMQLQREKYLLYVAPMRSAVCKSGIVC